MFISFQESWNELSKLSCKACSCLAGYNDQTSASSHNDAIRSVLSSLLTRFIVCSLAEEEPKNVSTKLFYIEERRLKKNALYLLLGFPL